jgi:hypothetical protein
MVMPGKFRVCPAGCERLSGRRTEGQSRPAGHYTAHYTAQYWAVGLPSAAIFVWGLGGRVASAVEIAGITFRHRPAAAPGRGEVAGHLHPSASLTVRGRKLTRRCFVADQRRLLLPAFGIYTGGLDVLDPAIASLFADGFHATLLGEHRVHALPHHRLERREAANERRRPGGHWGRC